MIRAQVEDYAEPPGSPGGQLIMDPIRQTNDDEYRLELRKWISYRAIPQPQIFRRLILGTVVFPEGFLI